MLIKLKDIYLKNRLLINLFLIGVLFVFTFFFKTFAWIPFVFIICLCVIDSVKNGWNYMLWGLPYLTMLIPKSLIFFVLSFAVLTIKMFVISIFKRKQKYNLLELVSICLVIVYLCLPIGEYNWNFFLKMPLILCFLFCFCGVTKNSFGIDFKKSIRILAVSLLISAFFALTNYDFPGLNEDFGILHRFSAMFDNANIFAVACEIVLGFLIYVFVSDKKWYDALLMISIAIIGCLTFSRTYLIILCVLTLVLFCCFIKSHTKQTLIATAIGLILIFTICAFYPKWINYVLKRFSNWEGQDFITCLNRITSGRYVLWKDYLKYMIENPLALIFGCGLGAKRVSYSSPHNIFIATIYQLGLVGVVLLAASFIIISKRKGKKTTLKRFDFALVIPILAICMAGLMEDIFMFIAVL